MPNPLVCPSCDCKIKAKEEQAGRKIKCPRCGNVIAVPKRDEVAEIEVEEVEELGIVVPRRRAAPIAEVPRQHATEEHDEDRLQIRKKGILHRDLSKDVRELDHSLKNFDVSRFTIMGWLAFLVSVAAAGCAYIYVEMNYEWIMHIPQDQRTYLKSSVPHTVAVMVSGFGCFFGALVVLKLVGIKLIRPKVDVRG